MSRYYRAINCGRYNFIFLSRCLLISRSTAPRDKSYVDLHCWELRSQATLQTRAVFARRLHAVISGTIPHWYNSVEGKNCIEYNVCRPCRKKKHMMDSTSEVVERVCLKKYSKNGTYGRSSSIVRESLTHTDWGMDTIGFVRRTF